MSVRKMIVFFLLVGLQVQIAHSQQMVKFRGSDGWGVDTRYEQAYDAFNLQTFRGSVAKVDTVTPMTDMGMGIQILLKTESGDIAVHLGPAWYILNQDLNFPKNEKLEVKGCRVSTSSGDFVMAMEILRKDRIVRLRDTDGNPLWSVMREK